jgi:hypothetical protein
MLSRIGIGVSAALAAAWGSFELLEERVHIR